MNFAVVDAGLDNYRKSLDAHCNTEFNYFCDVYADYLTNKILSESGCLEEYKGETHGTGYLRTFFDTVKSATDSSIERCFVTGVSPVTMDDLTSGFNIGTTTLHKIVVVYRGVDMVVCEEIQRNKE